MTTNTTDQKEMQTPKKTRRINTYDIVLIGLMAASCFVATYFRIDIPTPLGKTMIHFGNIFCLLSGLLLGGFRGGMAAGIGSMFFDLLDPVYIATAPFTFVFKFLMAFVCGTIANSGGRKASKLSFNAVGAVCGAVLYTTLYLGKNFITDYFLIRNPIETVVTSLITKGTVSLTNGIIAVVVSVLLAPIFKVAMDKSGLSAKLAKHV